MRLIRVSIANVNTTVGAVWANTERVLRAAHRASADGSTVVVFPEQVLGGYSPEDLVQWDAFVEAQRRALARFAEETASSPSVFALGVVVAHGGHIYNCGALVHRGRVLGFVPKEKLPTYNVFYEARTFARGVPGQWGTVGEIPFGDLIFEFDFGTVALEVCEDLWSPDGPMRRRAYGGAELVLNLSASPFRVGMDETRRETIATRTADNQCTLVYANLVGANDGLIFDGGGFVGQNGRLLLAAPRFREQVVSCNVDMDRTRRLRRENTTWRSDQQAFVEANPPRCTHRLKVEAATAPREGLTYPVPAHGSFFLPAAETPKDPRAAFCETLLDALALGVGDYFEKTGAFRTIGVALSGGRDSLLCLFIARRSLEKKFADLPPEERRQKARGILRAFFMPSRYSSLETRRAAEKAAEELDAPLVILDIDDAFAREEAAAQLLLQPGETLTPLARQNIQARLRAQRMWTWANSSSGLFLQTSNMSEKSVGYTTIGGDMEGALSVIANVPKTVVNYVLDYLKDTTHLSCIGLTLEKPASAELAEDQEDERDLMPFPVLDACFSLFAGEKMGLEDVVLVLRALFPQEDPARLDGWARKFGRLFQASIYKWVQTPLSLHVGNLDLERERALQLPVVASGEWLTPPPYGDSGTEPKVGGPSGGG